MIEPVPNISDTVRLRYEAAQRAKQAADKEHAEAWLAYMRAAYAAAECADAGRD